MKSINVREVLESPIEQGVDEIVAYRFNWTKIGLPTNPIVKLYNVTNNGYEDLSSTLLEGSVFVEEYYVTTPKVKSLTEKKRYKLECKSEVLGNTLELYCFIDATV